MAGREIHEVDTISGRTAWHVYLPEWVIRATRGSQASAQSSLDRRVGPSCFIPKSHQSRRAYTFTCLKALNSRNVLGTT
jgi:hypothetical protein